MFLGSKFYVCDPANVSLCFLKYHRCSIQCRVTRCTLIVCITVWCTLLRNVNGTWCDCFALCSNSFFVLVFLLSACFLRAVMFPVFMFSFGMFHLCRNVFFVHVFFEHVSLQHVFFQHVFFVQQCFLLALCSNVLLRGSMKYYCWEALIL